MGDIMKCDRCGKKGHVVDVTIMGTIYEICKDCTAELNEFMKGAELRTLNDAYFTVMYEEDGHENN